MVTPVGSVHKVIHSQPAPALKSDEVEPREPVAPVDEAPLAGVDVQEVLAPYDSAYGPQLAKSVCRELKVDASSRVSGEPESMLREALRCSALVMDGINAVATFRSSATPR